jgi:copper chaperone CopZ
MIQDYQITGMTCKGCKEKVQNLLSGLDQIKNVQIDLAKGEAQIEMDRYISIESLKSALREYPKYQITENKIRPKINGEAAGETTKKSWLITYKPLLLIFTYILMLSFIWAISKTGFDARLAMRIFMSGFFLTFSFFKMLDLKGFAESYAMYDIVAKRFRSWGFIYAFIELYLGIAYSLDFTPLLTNLLTVTVMTVSLVGVLQSVIYKRQIRCACLGSVFNLPMSTVTILEDGLMILMGTAALFMPG